MNESKEIRYTTPDEQILSLTQKHLQFENIENAKALLTHYGYYNIINSYKEPYIKIENNQKIYAAGTTFEQIYSLFIFDHNLRNSIMAAMLDFEEHLRAAAAEVISHSFGTHQDDYLRFDNYRDRHNTRYRFSLNGILGTLRNNLASDKDPIRYYRENYNHIPPWILFKGTYFGTLINFTRLFKKEQKTQLIRLLYNVPEETAALQCMRNLLAETLFTCSEYRNLAAHGGRVYNYNSSHPNCIPLDPALFKVNPALEELHDRHGISQLLILLDCFYYQQPCSFIKEAIFHELNRHLINYPDDIAFIEKAAGINIFFDPLKNNTSVKEEMKR